MTLRFVPATEAHALAMHDKLREGDRRECVRLGKEPIEALRGSIARSVEKWTALDDGEPIATWGLTAATFVGQVGCPWLLTTPGVERHKRVFLRETRWWVDNRAMQMYPYLANIVDAEYREAIRWLRWLGFEIGAPTPQRPFGHLFCLAEKRRS